MTEQVDSETVLREILSVLRRIEDKLDRQQTDSNGLKQTERGALETKPTIAYDERTSTASSVSLAADTPSTDFNLPRPSRKGTPTYSPSPGNIKVGPIQYSQWSINQLDGLFNFTLYPGLQRRLGDCWKMPDDDRLPLKFFKSNILKHIAPWGAPLDSFPTARPSIEKALESLCQFDDNLRVQPGNDFMVVDFDTLDNTRLYRLGDEAIGSELEVEPQGSQTAPWSRLMLYQGATTGDSIHTASKMHAEPIPYFTSTDKILGLWDHLDYHLQTKRRGTIINPYLSAWNGFHTNFYEVKEITQWKIREIWKHGPLYGHPLGWYFKKCAYTIYSPVPPDVAESPGQDLSKLNRHWTLLVLAPDYFFNDKNTSFPTSASSPGKAQALGYTLGKLTDSGAEIHLIGQGMERITQRWAEFLSYFDYILDGGDSLMKPAEHDNLLFDDGAFSRSRKYFWAIDCLSEFELSITDNIVQWELYKAARLPPIKQLPELDHRQLVFAERQYRVLQNQRDSFRQKLASTKALRDALFNASTVIESRAATRLGENVKLLTFVSIFFLPLAFTTSLWSVNDQFSMTALIYVIIIVALCTYFAMFNINGLAQGFSRIYDLKKKRVVCAMKCDRNQSWNLLGQRFEVFRPKYEPHVPSEWYIPLYALMHPMAVLGLGRNKEAADGESASDEEKTSRSRGGGSVAGLFRRHKPKLKEPDESEQPWVIE